MCKQPELRFSRLCALALIGASLLVACRGTPPVKISPPGTEQRGPLLQEVADYALWVRRQSDEILRVELARLEASPDSPERSLSLALILGQRQSSLYDPERTAQLLAQVAGQGPEDSVPVQLAQALLGVLPPTTRNCAATECEEKLNTVVVMEEQRRRELSQRIDALRVELESERGQRQKLESQLEALKSLEAQIKNRDGPPNP
jgi:hypothetical protein